MEGGKRKSPNANGGACNPNSNASNSIINNNNNNNSNSNINNNSTAAASGASAASNASNMQDDVRSIDSASMHSKHSGSISDLTRKSEQGKPLKFFLDNTQDLI